MSEQSLAPGLTPGTVLSGRYKIIGPLGEGGMGAVYEAEQTGLGRKVAIKVLHRNLAFDRDAIARFQREAQAAASLGHPNIVQVIDFEWPENEAPFLVMERLEGRSLATAVRAEGQIESQRVIGIARQIANALEVAHAAGIVHRDIKPDNIFLVDVPGSGEFAKILDFGIAKLEAPQDGIRTSTGTMLGSPAFMAPEQARGGKVDARADIFALGSTMYRALSGKLPFDEASVNALLFAIAEQIPKPLNELVPGIDPHCAAIVERAMQKDPAARFQTAAELRAALDDAKSASSSSAATSAEAFADTISTAPAALGTPGQFESVASLASPASESIPPPGPRPTTPNAAHAKSNATRNGALIVLALGAAVGIFAWTKSSPSVEITPSTVNSAGSAIASASSTPVASAPSLSASPSTAAITPTSSSAPSAATAHVQSTSINPAPTHSAKTASAPDPVPAPLSLIPDGQGPLMSGVHPKIVGAVHEHHEYALLLAGFEPRLGLLQQCYVAFSHTPPDHQVQVYRFHVEADGKVVSFLGGPPTTSEPRIAPLDQCVARAFIGAAIGASDNGAAGDISVSIGARKPDYP